MTIHITQIAGRTLPPRNQGLIGPKRPVQPAASSHPNGRERSGELAADKLY